MSFELLSYMLIRATIEIVQILLQSFYKLMSPITKK